MIILEGTDAVGKTSVIESLPNYNLKDRDKFISSLFLFNISLEDRVKHLVNYLKNSNNKIIFLINNDKIELENRVNKRPIKDEYDKYTYIYNLLYLETYLYMEQNNLLNNKLFMINVTNLNINEETKKVENLLSIISKDN
jgi:hypothetical protein